MGRECDSDNNCSWSARNSTENLGKNTGVEEERIKTIQITARWARILRRIVETRGDLLKLQ